MARSVSGAVVYRFVGRRIAAPKLTRPLSAISGIEAAGSDGT
jgi:hypothetical protein